MKQTGGGHGARCRERALIDHAAAFRADAPTERVETVIQRGQDALTPGTVAEPQHFSEHRTRFLRGLQVVDFTVRFLVRKANVRTAMVFEPGALGALESEALLAKAGTKVTCRCNKWHAPGRGYCAARARLRRP